MQYRVVITETNIDEDAHPEVFRYVLDAETEADAAVTGRERFSEQTGREVSPRAIIDVDLLP
jgi:thymidylate synthase ThyX